MVLTLILYGIVGGLAGWLITTRWGFSLWKIVTSVTLAGFLFIILTYYLQTTGEPKNTDYITDMIRYMGWSIPEIIAANLGAMIAAAIADRH